MAFKAIPVPSASPHSLPLPAATSVAGGALIPVSAFPYREAPEFKMSAPYLASRPYSRPSLSLRRGRRLKGKKGKSHRPRSNAGRGSLPRMLNLATTFSKTMRFWNISGSNASVTISLLELIGSMGGICTVTNSTVVHWTTSIRIKSIILFSPVAASTASNVTLEWNAGLGFIKDECRNETTPGGVATAPYIVLRPPGKSFAGDWLNVSQSPLNLFNLFNAPNLCVIDVNVVVTNPVAFSASTLSSTVATGTLGQVYYLPLDGPSSNKITPVMGYPTTH
jgi:hypothetical protein